jgi:hypothetical protein
MIFSEKETLMAITFSLKALIHHNLGVPLGVRGIPSICLAENSTSYPRSEIYIAKRFQMAQ